MACFCSLQDLERNDILEQYRSLSLEAEKFETRSHQLESEGSNLRLELMTRENESRRLRERIDLLERDIKEVSSGNLKFNFKMYHFAHGHGNGAQ